MTGEDMYDTDESESNTDDGGSSIIAMDANNESNIEDAEDEAVKQVCQAKDSSDEAHIDLTWTTVLPKYFPFVRRALNRQTSMALKMILFKHCVRNRLDTAL